MRSRTCRMSSISSLGLVMRHAGGGLVQQKQLGLADQRAANFDAAAIDHRQAGNRLEHAVGERRLEHLDQRARGAIACPRTRA